MSNQQCVILRIDVHGVADYGKVYGPFTKDEAQQLLQGCGLFPVTLDRLCGCPDDEQWSRNGTGFGDIMLIRLMSPMPRAL